LIGNLGYFQVREAIDGVRLGVGVLRPAVIELNDLLPPETALAQDALNFAEEMQKQVLLFHTWRTYLFGVLLAAHEEIPVDRSLLFAAAILHDTAADIRPRSPSDARPQRRGPR
jgi:ABC-type taurine transport system ATPase subunit